MPGDISDSSLFFLEANTAKIDVPHNKKTPNVGRAGNGFLDNATMLGKALSIVLGDAPCRHGGTGINYISGNEARLCDSHAPGRYSDKSHGVWMNSVFLIQRRVSRSFRRATDKPRIRSAEVLTLLECFVSVKARVLSINKTWIQGACGHVTVLFMAIHCQQRQRGTRRQWHDTFLRRGIAGK